MGKIGNFVNGLKPPILIVVSQVIVAGVNIVYKFAANDGISLGIVIANRLIFATGVMVPLALIFEREALGRINGRVVFHGCLGGSFGMEKLALGTTAGKAKLLGTFVGIGGAMIFTFYKGIEINIWSTNVNLLHHNHQSGYSAMHSGKFIFGAFLGFLGTTCYALWLIVQAKMSMAFPCLCSRLL